MALTRFKFEYVEGMVRLWLFSNFKIEYILLCSNFKIEYD